MILIKLPPLIELACIALAYCDESNPISKEAYDSLDKFQSKITKAENEN